jgi:predicted nucleic acid-binding protein
MVLVDTSVRVEHLRRGDRRLSVLLGAAEVLCHPFVVGELACGNPSNRGEILDLVAALPSIGKADHQETLRFIERNRLQGRGLGRIGMHLHASCALARTPLWTLDARLGKAAAALGVGGKG